MEEAITWQEMTSFHLRRPEVTRKWHSTGSHLQVAVEGQKLLHTVHFTLLQACFLQEEAVTWQEMTSHELKQPKVTRKWRHLTGSHLQVAVEGQKLLHTVRFTSYKAVPRWRMQSRDRKWRHLTSGHRKWPESDVIKQEVTWRWL